MRYDQMCKHQDQRTMTSDHGQLLQDSGFSKLDSQPSSLDSSVLTITKDQIELYYLLEKRTLTALYSGRLATATTLPTGDPSTSANPRTAAECIASLRRAMEKLFDLSCSPKTSSRPSRSECPGLPSGTLSWGRNWAGIPQNFYLGSRSLSERGSIPMGRVMTTMITRVVENQ